MLSEPSQLCCANSPVRNFVRTVPVKSSQEELVFMRIVPKPYSDGRGFDPPVQKKHSFVERDHEIISIKEGLSLPRGSECGYVN